MPVTACALFLNVTKIFIIGLIFSTIIGREQWRERGRERGKKGGWEIGVLCIEIGMPAMGICQSEMSLRSI